MRRDQYQRQDNKRGSRTSRKKNIPIAVEEDDIKVWNLCGFSPAHYNFSLLRLYVGVRQSV